MGNKFLNSCTTNAETALLTGHFRLYDRPVTQVDPDHRGKQPSNSLKRATIYDVARMAGVSVSTASKALNDKGRMAEATRHRVREVARKSGFRDVEAPAPRSLTVGLLTLDGYGRFTPQILGGVEDALSGAACQLMLCDARRDPVRLRHYISTLIERQVDGLIVTGRATDPVPPVAARIPFPVIYAYSTCADATQSCVTVNDEHGGWLAARQLIRHGSERIAFLAGPSEVLAIRERLAGTRRALEEAGRPPLVQIVHGRWSEAFGFDAAQGLLASDPRIDGIICGSDQIARGAADGLSAVGIEVPRDVALVGYDNWTLIAEATRPPLTSIDMNLYHLGRTVALEMLDAMEGTPLETGTRQLDCSIAVRGSCPEPPEGDPEWQSPNPMIPDA